MTPIRAGVIMITDSVVFTIILFLNYSLGSLSITNESRVNKTIHISGGGFSLDIRPHTGLTYRH